MKKQIKVAIDVSPLGGGHSVRGIGMYTRNLVDALSKVDGLQIVQFTKAGELDSSVDLIHYPYFDLFFHTLPITQSRKFVVTVHDAIPLIFRDRYPLGLRGRTNLFLQKFALKGASCVITDSETSKKDIVRFLGIDQNLIKVVYLAPADHFRIITDAKKLEIVKEKYNLPDKFALYVGDVNWNKNLPGLIKSLEFLEKDLSLVLVGKAFMDGGMKEVQEINNLVDSLSLGERVRKLGFVDNEDLVGIYNLASVYCQTSFYEGFGLPILEAFASACPVAAARTQTLVEIAQEAAIFFDPYNPKDIAKIISSIVGSSKVADDLKNKGKERLRDFSWEKCAKETFEIYKKVVSE